MKTSKLTVLCVILLLLAMALPDSTARGAISARAGLSLQPDQFVLGGQVLVGHLLKVARFAPSVDVGFGDGVRVLTVNGDVLLPVLSTKESGPSLYVSTGPSLARWDFENGGGDTEIGWSLVGGARRVVADRTYGLEVRFGIGDIPDLKILVGMDF